MKAILIAGLLALVAGPALAEVVVVRDTAAVAGCKPLGEVVANSKLGGMLAQAAYNRALKQLKERVTALGGTHAQLIDSASGFTGSRMLAQAFACPTSPP